LIDLEENLQRLRSPLISEGCIAGIFPASTHPGFATGMECGNEMGGTWTVRIPAALSRSDDSRDLVGWQPPNRAPELVNADARTGNSWRVPNCTASLSGPAEKRLVLIATM
jgi:hypothetical protein